ncbi:MAG TPA: transglutaminase-like domain-containing protein [Candidatus Binataceae bacterium]|nr:transglutaminase-like domain-containing protein [Candidatus Binataceae bacterium]
MKNFLRLLILLLVALIFAAATETPLMPRAWAESKTGPAPSVSRNVSFTYLATITPAPAAKHLEIWIPVPHDNAWQQISQLSVDAALPHQIVAQADGNRILHLSADAPLPASTTIRFTFDAARRQETADLALAARSLPEPTDGAFAPFLRADALVPIDGEITQVSTTIGSAGAPALEQARAIYEYVVANMKYDKSGTGWGHGDAIYACNVHRGNCTDFHSLFIALARSRGIPARFTIGFPLGAFGAGPITGYHCWAEFYAGGVWVPIDASEAWKHPPRHDYYFGHLDADRVGFTSGRDLELTPRQHGAPLNYLIYPYAEVDGVALLSSRIKTAFSYRDLAATN